MGVDLKKDPDNLFALMMREKVISELMVRALLNEDMKKNNISISKEEVENAEKEVIDKFGSKEQLMEVLKLNGVTYDKFKKDLEDEIKLKKYVDSIAMVSVGEAAAKKYYDENPDKFKYPKKVRASHILISSNPEQIKEEIKKANKNISDEELNVKVEQVMAENLKKAEGILAQVKKNPANFAKIAKENSQDTVSALKGGDLGYFAEEEMVEEFSKKAFSMAPNTVSDIVKTPYGYHIIKVVDRKEAGTDSFEKTKKDIINYLESRDKVEILGNKIEALRKAAKIEFLDDSYNPESIQKKMKEQAGTGAQTPQDFATQNKEEKK